MSVANNPSFPDMDYCSYTDENVRECKELGHGRKFRGKWKIMPLCDEHRSLAEKITSDSQENRASNSQPIRPSQQEPRRATCAHVGCGVMGERRVTRRQKLGAPLCVAHREIIAEETRNYHNYQEIARSNSIQHNRRLAGLDKRVAIQQARGNRVSQRTLNYLNEAQEKAAEATLRAFELRKQTMTRFKKRWHDQGHRDMAESMRNDAAKELAQAIGFQRSNRKN